MLVDMLTYSAGRISLMVRGAASARSRRRGMLQPFNALLISWSGRGKIPNLQQLEHRSRYALPQGKALFSGFYLNELLTRLVHQNEPVPALFSSYEKTVVSLSNQHDLETSLRHFELDLLQILGYGVDLLHEGRSGMAVNGDTCYNYELETGLIEAVGKNCLVRGDTLIALAERQALDRRQTREARTMMRYILGYYLGDKPLKSRELFSTLS